jgi:hypothetical protein
LSVWLAGDVNYVWRVQKDGSGKVSIVDAQNNSIPVSKPPEVINKLAIIPVDSVIMSGERSDALLPGGD